MKQRFFLNWKALNGENLRIWHTHYKPEPARDHIANWQDYLASSRQIVVEVLEIAAEVRNHETVPLHIEVCLRGSPQRNSSYRSGF